MSRAPLPPRAIKPLPASVPLAKMLGKKAAAEPAPESCTLVTPIQIDEPAPQTVRTPAPDGCEPVPGSTTIVDLLETEPSFFAPPMHIEPEFVVEVEIEPRLITESGLRPRAATIPAFFPYDPSAEPVDLPMRSPLASLRSMVAQLVAFVRGLVERVKNRKLLAEAAQNDLFFDMGVGPSSSQAR